MCLFRTLISDIYDQPSLFDTPTGILYVCICFKAQPTALGASFPLTRGSTLDPTWGSVLYPIIGSCSTLVMSGMSHSPYPSLEMFLWAPMSVGCRKLKEQSLLRLLARGHKRRLNVAIVFCASCELYWLLYCIRFSFLSSSQYLPTNFNVSQPVFWPVQYQPKDWLGTVEVSWKILFWNI